MPAPTIRTPTEKAKRYANRRRERFARREGAERKSPLLAGLRKPESPRLPISGTENVLTRRDFLLGGAAALFLAGCEGEDGGAQGAGTREVTFRGGSVTAPRRPKRVVSLWFPTSTNLVDLGLTPLGTSDAGFAFPEELRGEFPEDFDPASVKSLGSQDRPNLERVAALEPDLILCTDFQRDELGDELERIAPTAGLLWDGDWQLHFEEVARVVGREREAARVVREFEETVAKARERVPQGFEVAFLTTEDGATFRINRPTSFPGMIAEKLGLTVKDPVESGEKEDFFIAVSTEKLGIVRAPMVFVTEFDESRESLTFFEDQPLWKTLPAVRRGAVETVPFGLYGGASYVAGRACAEDMAARVARLAP